MVVTAKKTKATRALFAKRKKKVNAKTKAQQFDIRIIVQKSNKYVTAQAINAQGKVVAVVTDAASKAETKTLRAMEAGKNLASKLTSQSGKFVFDRNGYLYHGRIKAFADGLREGGIQI